MTLGSHPEVLRYIEKVMKGVNYRTRDFERILYHTKLFQRESSPVAATPGVDYAFVGPQLRRLSAEQLYDSFTVLAFGNTDDNINTALEEKWKTHQASIRGVIKASPQQLIKAGEAANEAEEARRAYGRKQTELRVAAQKAQKAGNTKQAKKINEQIAALRREAAQKRSSAMESSSMASIGMRRYPGREARASINMRASEHPSPFRPDHIVRQFGGSDRTTPEAAHTNASVPQVLTLLNGQIANSAENRKSKIFEALSEITNPEQRLEYLFLAFYSSRPSAEEVKEMLPLAENREDIFTLARAMLTSKRFLFVQ